MASILKAQSSNAAIADAKGKGKGKRAIEDTEADGQASAPKRRKNKQRVLLLSSRGVTHRMRHLLNDIEVLLPHVKKGTGYRFDFCEESAQRRTQIRSSIPSRN